MHSDDAGRFGIKAGAVPRRNASVDVLNPLLRMAIITGVDSAVALHISRGDNLNARDADGLTPLMLCALRNRHRVCSQLLEAGSDPTLLSPQGHSAYQMALEKGAVEVAALLDPNGVGPLYVDLTYEELTVVQGDQPKVVLEEGRADYIEFPDLDAWEADEIAAPPAEVPELAQEAARVHEEISLHVPEDSDSEDWADIDAYLPEMAVQPTRLRDSDDVYGTLRLLFLRAVREGSVPMFGVEDVAETLDAEGNAQLIPHLTRLIGDLGADLDERFEYQSVDEDFEVYVNPDASEPEDDLVSDTLMRLDEILSRRNEPIRQYLRSIQRHALLDAEQEVHLGREMEESLQEAIELIANDAASIIHILESIKLVKAGRRSLASIGRGWTDQEEPLATSTEPLQESSHTHVSLDESIDGGEESEDEPSLHALSNDDKLLELELVLENCVESGVTSEVRSNAVEQLNKFRPSVAFLWEVSDRSTRVSSASDQAHLCEVLDRYERARERMVTSNLKLVLSNAKKYTYTGMELDDLVQEGNIGLLKAVERYDWRKGFRFSTYATWWIRQQIWRSVADLGRTIRVPVHVHEKLQKLRRFIRRYEAARGVHPSVEEIAAELSMPTHKVGPMLTYMQEVSSLDAIDGDWPLDPSQVDRMQCADPEDVAAARESRQMIHELIDGLPRNYRDIIRLRFGIGSRDAMTLEEVGQIKGLTRERIRQLETKALRTLKNSTKLEWLQGKRALSTMTVAERMAQAGTAGTDSLEGGDQDRRADEEVQMRPASESMNGVEASKEAPGIEALLFWAKSLGIDVQDQRSNDAGRLWVLLTSLSDAASYRLLKQLKALGFQEEAGKGYWK